MRFAFLAHLQKGSKSIIDTNWTNNKINISKNTENKFTYVSLLKYRSSSDATIYIQPLYSGCKKVPNLPLPFVFIKIKHYLLGVLRFENIKKI